MKYLDIDLKNYNITNSIGFATALVSKACEATSDEINIKTNDGVYVNLKSIMGVLTLNYHTADKLTFQVMGETEDYTVKSLEKFIKKEIEHYSK